MQCEMCGETIRGTAKLVRVEGAELQVCTKCEKFGTEVQQVTAYRCCTPGHCSTPTGKNADDSSSRRSEKTGSL